MRSGVITPITIHLCCHKTFYSPLHLQIPLYDDYTLFVTFVSNSTSYRFVILQGAVEPATLASDVVSEDGKQILSHAQPLVIGDRQRAGSRYLSIRQFSSMITPPKM